jgi:uncharacterized protein (TIGR03000 family)
MYKIMMAGASLLVLALLAIAQQPDDDQKGPPASKAKAQPEPSNTTKIKEVKAKDAINKAKKLRDQATAAREAYEKALDEADQADQDAALAESDYRVSVAKDASARADAAKVEADRAVAEAKQADNDRIEADRIAADALRKAKTAGKGGQSSAPPAVAGKSPLKTGHPPTIEDLSKYIKKPPTKVDLEQSKDKTSKSQSKKIPVDKGPEPGIIVLKVPPTALVKIDDTPTNQTGATRTFATPPLGFGNNYTYQITVSLDGNNVTRVIIVRAGETTTEDFTK